MKPETIYEYGKVKCEVYLKNGLYHIVHPNDDINNFAVTTRDINFFLKKNKDNIDDFFDAQVDGLIKRKVDKAISGLKKEIDWIGENVCDKFALSKENRVKLTTELIAGIEDSIKKLSGGNSTISGLMKYLTRK